MQKIKTTAKAVTMILAVALLFNIAYASEAGNPNRKIIPAIMDILAPPSEAESRNLANQLEMTPEQRKQTGKLYTAYINDTKSFKKQYDVKFNQLLTLMRDPAPNGKKVEQECQEFLALERKVVNAEIRYWNGLKKTLTRKQNNQLWNYMEARRLK